MSDEERFSSTHWLKFRDGKVTGCSCGFPAADEDEGCGDTVVDHIAWVARASLRRNSMARFGMIDAYRGGTR